jgi:dUTP pyrophosphatase
MARKKKSVKKKASAKKQPTPDSEVIVAEEGVLVDATDEILSSSVVEDPREDALLQADLDISVQPHPIDVDAEFESLDVESGTDVEKLLIIEDDVEEAPDPVEEVRRPWRPALEYVSKAGYDLEKRDEDSGYDVRATRNLQVPAGGVAVVPTGIFTKVPIGYEIQVRSRSGLAARRGIHVLNGPGTVDSGYRGEIGVILHNTTREVFDVTAGDRVAQLVMCELPRHTLVKVSKIVNDSDRGIKGHGSSGVK